MIVGIKENLEGISENAKPRGQHGELRSGLRGDQLPQRAHTVGQQHLFAHAKNKALGALVKALPCFRAVVQLLGDGDIAHDGTGDELREHGHIAAKGDDVMLHRALPAVDVDGIGHGLEGIEGDADGQRDLGHVNRQPQQVINGLHSKARVLKEAEQPQIDDAGGNEHSAAQSGLIVPFFDQKAVGIVHKGGKDHQHHINGLAPCIENQRHDEQNQIAQLLGHEEVQKDHQRHKQQQIAQR